MGCTGSTTNGYKQEHGQDRKVMPDVNLEDAKCQHISPEERETVMETWHLMTDNMSCNGLQVFLRIFELCPEAKKLFKIENVRHRDVARNPIIKGHGSRFMQAVGAAVDRLNDAHLNNSDDLDQLLLLLGHQHKRYDGFQPRYFDVFYDALMWQWERKMGEKFTHEVASAWSHVFVYIMMKLKEGYFQTNSEINRINGQ